MGLAKPASPVGRETVKLLRSVVFFQTLPDPKLQELAARMQMRTLRAGERLYKQGEPGNSLAIVCSGLLRIVVATESGIEVTIGKREPGTVIGEMALLDGKERSASADAVEDSSVWLLERERFYSLLEENPKLARYLLSVLSERLREAAQRIRVLAHGSVRHRVAKLLADLAVFQGEVDGVRVRLAGLDVSDLTTLLGLERRNVSRALSYFRSQGFIDGDSRGIVICDLHALRKLSQQVESF